MSGQMCFGINDAFERVPNRIISQSVVVPQLLSNLSIAVELFFSPKRLKWFADSHNPYFLFIVQELLSAQSYLFHVSLHLGSAVRDSTDMIESTQKLRKSQQFIRLKFSLKPILRYQCLPDSKLQLMQALWMSFHK